MLIFSNAARMTVHNYVACVTQAVSQTLWFGRDAIGRRSLLIHLPSTNDPRFLLTSVAPDVREDKAGSFEYWEDLACGIYSVAFSAVDEGLTGKGTGSSFTVPATSGKEGTCQGPTKKITPGWARAHRWEDSRLRTLLAWDRQHVTPDKMNALESIESDQFWNSGHPNANFPASNEGQESPNVPFQRSACDNESSRGCEPNDLNWREGRKTLDQKDPVEQVLSVLRQAVKRRTVHIRQHSVSTQPFLGSCNC